MEHPFLFVSVAKIVLENCALNSTGIVRQTEGGVHAWVWRSKEGRNGGIEPGGYVNQAPQHAGCCVIKDSSPIVRTSNSPNFNFILEFIQSLL